MLVTERNFRRIIRHLGNHTRLVVDSETNGLYTWHGHRLIGVAVATPHAERDDCFYFPFRHKPGGNLGDYELSRLMSLLDVTPVHTGWNYKFDLHMLKQEGLADPYRIEDVMLLFHLLDENQWKTGGSYELKVAAESYVDQSARAAQLRLTNLLADRGLTKGAMDQLAPNDVADYATDDVYYTERMRSLLLPAAKEWELVPLWREINQYATIVRRFEERGVLLDVPLIEQYQEECRRKCARLATRIKRSAGEINLDSPKQVQAWLGVPSTAADYLEEIQWTLTPEQNKNIELLQQYRQWGKALGTYYNKYMEMKDSQNVLHPNIKLHATITGRPGSENPNMQAVPLYTEIYKVKDVIMARPGYTLVSADYSQMELRLGAHYAKDPILMKAFQEGRSPHKEMQQELKDEGLEVDYTTSKNVNFSLIYGVGVPTLAKRYMKGNTKLAAQTLTAAHEKHPHYRPFLKQTEQVARNYGFIRMWTGRVRRFNTLKDPQPWFHKAGPNLIQGGAMECLRVAIMRLDPILKQHDSHMLLQVYDQLLIEVPTKKVKKVSKIIQREMTRDFPFDVPLAVEIKVGQRWGKLEELK